MPVSNPTEIIARQALSYEYTDLPAPVQQMAKLIVLDNLGCALRGASEPLAQMIGEELYGRQITAKELLSGELQGPLHNRAMFHAAAGHAIDFDDTLPPAQAAHAGSSVVGAVLSLANETEATGAEMLSAVIAGFETAARVGALLHSDHYLLGFHPTATVGVFGAAAAAGRMLKFDEMQMRAALGLAATQACGLKCTFGTMTKPYNAAHAAGSGTLSARLVARGYTAPLDALEADKGYLAMFIGLPEEERSVEGVDQFRILGNAFKFHAACHATHPMIEGLKELQSAHSVGLQSIDRIEVSTTPLSLKTASIGEPSSGLEGKFSFSHVAAVTLLGYDTASDSAYSDDTIQDPDVMSLRQSVQTAETEEHPFLTTVTLALKDGQRLETRYDFRELMRDLDTVQVRLLEKFSANAGPVIGESEAETLKTDLMNLEAASTISALAA